MLGVETARRLGAECEIMPRIAHVMMLEPGWDRVARRIAEEAVSNAVRHATANKILISLRATTRTLTLEVRDDGQGLAVAPTASHKLSGVALMQRHAHEIQGKLELHSEPGQGTRVWCTVPLASQPKPTDL